MVVTKLENSCELIKQTTSKFEWRLENYDVYQGTYSETFGVSNDTKM